MHSDDQKRTIELVLGSRSSTGSHRAGFDWVRILRPREAFVNLREVVEKYRKQAEKQYKRAERQGREKLSPKEVLAVAAYVHAAARIETMILPEDTQGEGFEVRSDAPAAAVRFTKGDK
jgi:hypothetical protein